MCSLCPEMWKIATWQYVVSHNEDQTHHSCKLKVFLRFLLYFQADTVRFLSYHLQTDRRQMVCWDIFGADKQHVCGSHQNRERRLFKGSLFPKYWFIYEERVEQKLAILFTASIFNLKTTLLK